MEVELLYPHIVKSSNNGCPFGVEFYKPYHARFVGSYRKFAAGYRHRMRVIFCGAEPSESDLEVYDGLTNITFDRYDGDGWDIGAHQATAIKLNCDAVMSFVTPAYFNQDAWLLPFVEAFQTYGDGLYGAMASFQHMPHIRSGSFMYSPSMMRQYPWVIDSREVSFHFESGFGMDGKIVGSGEKCFTNWMLAMNKPALMVTRDNCYEMQDWRRPANIFRRGDQSNCLIWDRHNDIYAAASEIEKRELELLSDTLLVP